MYIPTLFTVPGEPETLWQEIVRYFRNYFDTMKNTEYENLGFGGSGSMITIPMIVIAIAAAIIISSISAIINKTVLGGFVRAVIKDEALSPESAKTLEELGYDEKLVIRRSVRKSINLRSVIRCVEEEQYNERTRLAREEYDKNPDPHKPKFVDAPYQIDPDNDHFYIPEENKYKADMKFDKRGTSWGMFWVIIIITVIFSIALLVSLPKILDIANEFFGSIANSAPKDRI
jgi:hypothetical protein